MEASPVQQASELPERSRIGERLREERQRSGMTVREIARRVGVSPSLISQIERDKVTPSVSTLWGLVTVLGLTMGELFSEGAQPTGVQSPSTASSAALAPIGGPATIPGSRAIISLETGVQWERLTASGDALVEFLSVVYPPGAASCGEDSLVRHGGKEYGYVISGRLGVRIGFDKYELGPAWRSPSTPPRRTASGRSATSPPRRSGSSSAGRTTAAAR